MNLSKEEQQYQVGDYVKAISDGLFLDNAVTQGNKYMITGIENHAVYIDGNLPYYSRYPKSIDPGWYMMMEEIEPWAEILSEEKERGITITYANESLQEQITRLTQELKEAKEYRKKVEAVIEKWSESKIREIAYDINVANDISFKFRMAKRLYYKKGMVCMLKEFKQIK